MNMRYIVITSEGKYKNHCRICYNQIEKKEPCIALQQNNGWVTSYYHYSCIEKSAKQRLITSKRLLKKINKLKPELIVTNIVK